MTVKFPNIRDIPDGLEYGLEGILSELKECVELMLSRRSEYLPEFPADPVNLRYIEDYNKVYVPYSLTATAGGLTGDATDMQNLLDGNALQITEVAATPGFDVKIHYADVLFDPTVFVMHYDYEGTINHNIGIDIYNVDNAGWDRLHYITDTDDYRWITIALPDVTRYKDASNNINVRLYHINMGNINHDLYVGYAAFLRR